MHSVIPKVSGKKKAGQLTVRLAALNVAMGVALLLIEYLVPNNKRWTELPPDSAEFLPRSLTSASDAAYASVSSYIFGYSRILVASFAAICALSALGIWLHRSADAAVDEIEGGGKADSERTVRLRRELRMIDRLKDTVAEPVLGALTLTMASWLAVVVLVAKLDIEWFRGLIPSPWHVVRQLQVLAPEFAGAMVRSGGHLLVAILLGSTIGVMIGYLLSRSPWLHRSTAFHVTIVAGLPPILLAEVFAKIAALKPVEWLLRFGSSADRIGTLMAAWAITWPTVTATTLALRSIDPEFRRSMRMLGARSTTEWLRHVELPVIQPAVFSNLRVGIAIGLIVLLYGEGRGGSPDEKTLGVWLGTIGSEFPIPQVFALLVFTSAVFIFIELGLRAVEFLAVRRSMRTVTSIQERSALADTYERRKALENFESSRAKWITGRSIWETRNGRPLITVGAARKTFSGQRAFSNAAHRSFTGGSVTSIIGKSGAGKSTFLKLILGFEAADDDANEIYVGDPSQRIDEGGAAWADDHVCYVSQRTTLLTNKSVIANLLFGVSRTLERPATTDDDRAIHEYLRWLLGDQDPSLLRGRNVQERIARTPLGYLISFFGLMEKLNQRPGELSGGEAQRVHLLRWLMLPRPVLVMDEAFSALDQPLKGMLRDAIKRHAQSLGIALVNVSHDRADVLQISDRILFINQGEIHADGSPADLYRSPTSRDLAIFLGHTNLFKVKVDSETVVLEEDEYRGVEFPKDQVRLTVSGSHISNSTTVFIPISALKVNKAEEASSEQFVVDTIRFLGTHYEARVSREVEPSIRLRFDLILSDAEYSKLMSGETTFAQVPVVPLTVVPTALTAISGERI